MRHPVAVLVVFALVTGCGDADTTTESTATEPLTTTTTVLSTLTPTTTTSPTTTTEPTTTMATTAPTTTVAPPMLEVTDPVDGAVVTTQVYTFRGVTDPGCTVSVGDRYHADVGADGTWALDLTLREGHNATTLIASTPAGDTTKTRITVTYEPKRVNPPMPCRVDVDSGQESCDVWGDIVKVDLGRSEIVFDLYRFVKTGPEEYEYTFVNENPLLRTLKVADDVNIRACPPPPGSQVPGEDCFPPDHDYWTLADLADFVAADAIWWNVMTLDSIVMAIEQPCPVCG